MKVFIDSYENLKNTEPLTITIGNFDGLHLGHQELINRTVSFYDTKPALLTFNPHPAKVLKNVKHQELTSMSQKISLLEQTPLQYAYFVNFTREFSIWVLKSLLVLKDWRLRGLLWVVIFVLVLMRVERLKI